MVLQPSERLYRKHASQIGVPVTSSAVAAADVPSHCSCPFCDVIVEGSRQGVGHVLEHFELGPWAVGSFERDV